ncbi:uncharacterized protein LOC143532206 [Bidens hawaiensis]|uniref:uncharacterized protein LOC143532206 n=1 Tax=Bidens hawaiensis TaxID=980011 RepID=UPI00404A516D
MADIGFRKMLTERVRNFRPRIRWGNLKDDNLSLFKDKLVSSTLVQLDEDSNHMWETLAKKITQVAKETLGVTTGKPSGHKESWWWNKIVQDKIRDKQESFRELMRCTDDRERVRLREVYKRAKKEAKKAVSEAKNTAYKQMERRRQDLYAVKFIKGEDRHLLVKEHDIRLRWKTYSHKLFKSGSAHQQQNGDTMVHLRNNCYCRRITQEEVRNALRKMGKAKAVGTDNILIKVLKCLGEEGVIWLTTLFTTT